jgi:hypothetical protein
MRITTQMERPARAIQTTFVRGFISLEHRLENLSKVVVKLVENLTAKGGPFGHLIDDLSMSEIKSEHSDGVIRRELESEEYAR